MGATDENAEAVGAAREAIAQRPDPRKPLDPLPTGFLTTRRSMHAVAEGLLKPKRVLETGNEIALCFTPGGFGAPSWKTEGGETGRARVEGCEVVLSRSDNEERAELNSLDEAAALLGVPPLGLDAEELSFDEESASTLATWFAFGTAVLAELVSTNQALGPAPIRLWPEHFDVATELGNEAVGGRANFGASPGDEQHPEPYLYVGPWDTSVSGDPWNASSFAGAELRYESLLAQSDQIGAAATFLANGLAALPA